jgi:hypothetical protein
MDITTLYIEYPRNISLVLHSTHFLGELLLLLYKIMIPVRSCRGLEKISIAA